MRLSAVVAMFADLGEAELTGWIARGWITPAEETEGPAFQEIDIARIRLILDLRRQMRIEDETIPLILSLLDQIYDLRSCLRSVVRAVQAQPEPVRDAIRAVLR
jgi:chaperone modulatory protein CbpM